MRQVPGQLVSSQCHMRPERDALNLGIVLSLLVLTALIVVGCEGNGSGAKGPPAESFRAVSADSMPSVVDVIIDATPSMQGFASSSEYRSLVALSLANASLSETTVEYHRLTTAASGGIAEVKHKIQVTRRSFYGQGNTKLERAISEADSDRLVVLVTDLFQTDADMNQVTEGLTRSILRDNQAVGLFGARFPFDGQVYDLGFERRSFSFKGERPLYGLVLGDPSAVSQYLKNLRRFIDSSDYRFLMLSERVAGESGSIQTVDSTDNLVEVTPNVIPQLPEPRYLGVSIRDNNKSAHLEAPLGVNVLSDISPLIGAEGVGVNAAKVWKYDSEREKYAQTFSNSEAVEKALTADVESNESGRLFRLGVQSKDLQRGSYCFNLVVGVERWTLPDWVSDWNLPPSQFQAENPDGTKTANLKPFLLDLASNITESRFPHLATLQVFVEKGR